MFKPCFVFFFHVFLSPQVTPSMGPCNGDSGGGLMDGEKVPPTSCHHSFLLLSHPALGQVVGITSWEARGCGQPQHPGVFLQVTVFLCILPMRACTCFMPTL